MTWDVDVYDLHAEALVRLATVLVGPDRAPEVVSRVVLQTLVRRPLADLDNPRLFLLREVVREAQSRSRQGLSNKQDAPVIPAPTIGTRLLLEMPMKQRAAVYFAYWVGLSSFETAGILKVRPFTVRRFLNMSQRRMRESGSDKGEHGHPWVRAEFREALKPILAKSPREERYDTIRSRVLQTHRRQRLRTLVAVAVGIAMVVGVGALVSSEQRKSAQPSPDAVSASTTVVTVAESSTAISKGGITITAPGPSPRPASDALCCAGDPFGFGTSIGADGLTVALQNELFGALAGVEIPGVDMADVVLWPAVIAREDVYTVVAQGGKPVGVIKTTDGVFAAFASGSTPWVEVVTRKNWGWITTVRLVWTGLPDDTAVVRLSMSGTASVLQRPVGQTVFFDIPRPGWDQIATLTAFDSSGKPTAMSKVELEGGGCSGRLSDVPFPDRTLPDDIGAVRNTILDAAIRCEASLIDEILRQRPGTMISVNGVARIGGMSRFDLDFPIMFNIGLAFTEPWNIEPGAAGDIFVWTLETDDTTVQIEVPLVPRPGNSRLVLAIRGLVVDVMTALRAMEPRIQPASVPPHSFVGFTIPGDDDPLSLWVWAIGDDAIVAVALSGLDAFPPPTSVIETVIGPIETYDLRVGDRENDLVVARGVCEYFQVAIASGSGEPRADLLERAVAAIDCF